MKDLDWTQFTTRINVKAPPTDLLNCWTSQDAIEKWFLRKAEFTDAQGNLKARSALIAAGDTYHWEWHGSDHIEQGEILENNGIDKIKFTFAKSIVTVHIKVEVGENIVDINQAQIPLDDSSRISTYVGCTSGWTFYLANLKSLMEGGIDLRNRNESLVNVVNT